MKILLTLMLTFNLFGCSTEKLYKLAINYERNNADLEVKYQSLDIGTIAYLENNHKSDTTTLLLHGFGAEKDIWNRFVNELDTDNHVIALDLPGHGESTANKKLDYSIANQAKIVHQFLMAKNIKTIHLIGNSMGGAIAIRYSASYSSTVKSLTLIDSMGTKNTEQELSALITRLGGNTLILNECTAAQFTKLIKTGMEQPPYIPGIFMDLLVSIKCARADVERIIFKTIRQKADLSKLYTNIKIPTLILWGRKDRIFNVENAQLFQNGISGSRMVIFDNIGHVPLLEDPEKTADAVNAFINKI